MSSTGREHAVTEMTITRAASAETPPRLCIALPVYNGSRFIEETLDSILGQSFRDFELIVTDNASTDDTRDIVERYAADDDRVHLVRHERNIGASANFDSAWQHCRSPYFKWVAADDICAPTFFESCLDALDQRPEAGLAYPETAFIGADSHMLHAFDQIVQTPHEWASSRARRSRQIVDVLLADGSSANVMIFGVIRSEVLREVRAIGNYFGADLPLVAELGVRAEVVEVPGVLSFLRRHDGSSSTYERAPSARSQQDFYDPSVRGSLRLQWNLRRRYVALLRVLAEADVGVLGKFGLIGSYVRALARRLVWRLKYERQVRSGETQPELQWEGGPVHWTDVPSIA